MEHNEARLQAMDLNQQAALLIKAGNLPSAEKKLEEAVAIDPMVMESYKNYGDLYMAREEYQEAKNAYKKAFLIQKDGLLYFLYGNACFMNDDVHEGLEYYNMAISQGYDSDQMMFFMGMAYEHLNDDNMALRYFQKACAKNPSRPDYQVKKITTEIRLNMTDAAWQDTDELLKRAPELFDGYHIKTMLLINQQKYEEAVAFASDASDRFPEDPDLKYDYIKSLAMNRQFDLALSQLEQAAQMKYYADSVHRFMILKTEILAECGRYDEALRSCEEAIRLETDKEDYSGEARFMAMNLNLAQGDHEKALGQALALLQKNDKDEYYYAALYYRAFCLRKLGRMEEADKAYKEANSIYRLRTLSEPSAIDVYLYRAMCLKDMEEYDKALELTDFILGLGTEIAEVYVLKGEIYDAMGKHASAQEQREKAFALKPALRPDDQDDNKGGE